MSDPESPLPPPPPPPPHAPPQADPPQAGSSQAQPQQLWAPAWQAPAGYVVDVDPASAGLVRQEKVGFGLPLAVLGVAAIVVSLFVDWVDVLLVTDDPDVPNRFETDSLFSAVDTVRDVTGQDPGALASLFFPWLAVALTGAGCVLAIAAAVGLRRAALTTTARVAAVTTVVVAGVLAIAAYADLGVDFNGGGDSSATVGPAPTQDAEPAYHTETEVQPFFGTMWWMAGAALLTIGGALGPRVIQRLPEGIQPTGGVLGTAVPGAASPPVPGALAGWMPAFADRPRVVHRTQVVAVVLTGLGAFLAFCGYAFLDWFDEVTFLDIGDAARDGGLGDRPFAEAYFGFLGWFVLLAAIGVAVIVALGRKPALNAKVWRPVVVISTAAGGLLHLLALVDIGADNSDFGVGAYAVLLGLALVGLGTILPLRTSAQVMVAPPVSQQPHAPQPAQPPPTTGQQ